MRTHKARGARDRAVVSAIFSGHDPQRLTHSGAMELWVCKNCNVVMDCWDNPAVVNGPMSRTRCRGATRTRLERICTGCWLFVRSAVTRWRILLTNEEQENAL
jgi:hypothetical protein